MIYILAILYPIILFVVIVAGFALLDHKSFGVPFGTAFKVRIARAFGRRL